MKATCLFGTKSFSKSRLARAAPLLFVTSVLVACAGVPRRPKALDRGDYQALQRYLEELIPYRMREHQVTGLSIALVDDQRIVWARGFGFADREHQVAATPDTLYRAGSISKLFTDTLAMQLAEQGRLDIDQSLQTYLPQFSIKSRTPEAGPITLRSLMTHHSGLPSDRLRGMWNEHPEPFTGLAAALRDEYVAYPPNLILSYSNLGLSLLGHAVAAAAGEDFAALAERSLLRPLGMTHSSFSTRIEGPQAALPYSEGRLGSETGLRDVPAGGLNTSVNDLSRFMQMVFADGQSQGKAIIAPSTLAEMLRPQNATVALDQDLRVGLGWFLSPANGGGERQAMHDGGTQHYRSALIILPDRKLGVAVMANSPSADAFIHGLAQNALDLALEVKAGRTPRATGLKVEPQVATLSDDQRRIYVGRYSTIFGLVQIAEHGASLRAEGMGQHFDLEPGSDGMLGLRYRLWGLFSIRPQALADVRVSRASIAGHEVLIGQRASGGRTLIGERFSPAELSEPWQRRAGEYELIEGRDDAVTPERVRLRIEDGVMVFSARLAGMPKYKAEWELPIMPVTNTEAVVQGLGRNLGDTIRVLQATDGERLVYSGYVWRRRPSAE